LINYRSQNLNKKQKFRIVIGIKTRLAPYAAG